MAQRQCTSTLLRCCRTATQDTTPIRSQLRQYTSRRTLTSTTPSPFAARQSRQQQASLLTSRERRRAFTTTPTRPHNALTPPKPGQERHITFIDKTGQPVTFEVGDGDNLLDIAQANDLEMEGACGGSCACSTCHIIVEGEEMYDKMEEPSDDENDMLDLAFGLTETSRLGCQVVMREELDGLVVSKSFLFLSLRYE